MLLDQLADVRNLQHDEEWSGRRDGGEKGGFEECDRRDNLLGESLDGVREEEEMGWKRVAEFEGSFLEVKAVE